MKPNLLETFERLVNEGWRGVFSQERVFARVRCLTIGLLVSLRTHLLSNAICAAGRQFQDWTADYRVWSSLGRARVIQSDSGRLALAARFG